MEHPAQAIAKTLDQIPLNQNRDKDLVVGKEWDGQEVTEEEKAAIIEEFKKKKFYALKQAQYMAKVLAEPQYPTYTTEQFKSVMRAKAKKLIPNFELDDQNKEIFDALCNYFTDNNDFLTFKPNLNMEKGLLLHGNIGCGKTTLMELFEVNPKASYCTVDCIEITHEFASEGVDELVKYNNLFRSVPNYFGHRDLGFCFDDMGTETTSKYYGNTKNVMEDILLRRYKKNHMLKGKTHITTNLKMEEIGKMYGQRVLDRLREMFNVIEFKPTATSRRK